MGLDLPPLRIALYFTLGIFSIVLLGLTSARIHYTTDLPAGDPLNDGVAFYDPIVVELLVTTILTMAWCIYIVRAIHKRVDNGFISTFRGELIGLFVLWLFWIVGAAKSSTIWGDLGWCQQYQPCRILTAMLAFAWLGWIVLTLIMILSIIFSVVNGAFNEPLHGRWDPRASVYTGNMSTRNSAAV
ncbi:uncharacterized protein ARMOST_17868 [Armillaria ostoyae]|uniref:MARVEL domain-containing protein n=1 Tax=Armillaria ostoyae TaxID=47428 RepID=A0A284S072_ARMOS|nr:uncharacterized protein ARMOST_17868 [Armillaria ostoyae]